MKIDRMIEQNLFRPGERIPSIRALARQLGVGINTITHAYRILESERVIEGRSRSGYYVCPRPTRVNPPVRPVDVRDPRLELIPSNVTLEHAQLETMRKLANERCIPLGRGAPSVDLLPIEKLNRMLAAQSRRFPTASVSYTASIGLERLRTQIAKRSLDYGCSLSADEIVITSGCVEAVTLALHATCRAGDTVAIESPVFYTFLNAIQWLGLKVLEIPATPHEGMSLDVIRDAVRSKLIRACLIISNFNNPMGSLMPNDKKRELVRLLASHDIPLIEDDVYGDLGFAGGRPPVFKAYDEKQTILLCSSFSKTLAPGYRVGWIAAGRLQAKIEALKSLFNIATATPTQLAIAEFLSDGGYDRHLRSSRKTLAQRMSSVRDAVMQHFPQGTRVTTPAGGFFLWVEMLEGCDGFELHTKALREGIGVAPGSLFTMGAGFRNCIRLNCSFWSEPVREAIATLGRLSTTAHRHYLSGQLAQG